MISETRMWYGSSVLRQGRSRPWRRYHASSRWRNRRRASAAGIGSARARLGAIIRTVKLYTRTGDSGETSLFDGTRARKDDPRIDAYGEIDELNAWIGLVRASPSLDAAVDAEIVAIQRDLFALGAQLADPGEKLAPRVAKAVIADEHVVRLE